MVDGAKPIRSVVTGNDARGKSRVVWDGPAPNAHPPTNKKNGYTDLWIYNDSPVPLSNETDDGDLPYDFPGAPMGGHLRVVHAAGRPAAYDPAQDLTIVPSHAPKALPSGKVWDRGGKNAFSSDMHKTQTVDYAIVLAGERVLRLDDCEVLIKPGDILIQVGAWHQWTSRGPGGDMAFDMIMAEFVDGGIAQGNDEVMRPPSPQELPAGVLPTRRIVTIDREPGKSMLVSDGPSPDIRIDPARPGFSATRMWVTDSTPAKIVFETLHLPHTLKPPQHGTVCRVYSFPPDNTWKGRVGKAEVAAYFAAMGSPGASTYSDAAPHPYMQKTRTLDFCFVIEGELVLVLDTQEVLLQVGDVVIQRGTNHAWSNRSSQRAVLAMASHDGA